MRGGGAVGDEVAGSVGCGGEGGERGVGDAGEVYGSREGGERLRGTRE